MKNTYIKSIVLIIGLTLVTVIMFMLVLSSFQAAGTGNTTENNDFCQWYKYSAVQNMPAVCLKYWSK